MGMQCPFEFPLSVHNGLHSLWSFILASGGLLAVACVKRATKARALHLGLA